MTRFVRCAFALLILALAHAARAAEPVDLLLVLAADVSRRRRCGKIQIAT